MIFNGGLYDSMTEGSFRSLPVASAFIVLFFKFFSLQLCDVLFATKNNVEVKNSASSIIGRKFLFKVTDIIF